MNEFKIGLWAPLCSLLNMIVTLNAFSVCNLKNDSSPQWASKLPLKQIYFKSKGDQLFEECAVKQFSEAAVQCPSKGSNKNPHWEF